MLGAVLGDIVGSPYEFVNEYADYYVEETVKRPVVIRENLKKFLEEQVKPTLTEDERVILRNIKGTDFEKIGRDKIGGLYIGFQHDFVFAGDCAIGGVG